MSIPMLVQDEDAQHFAQQASLEVGRKVMLGDQEKLDKLAWNALTSAHDAMADGVQKIGRLVSDPTRNEVLKHEAAQQVAERTIATLDQTQKVLQARANALHTEAHEIVEQRFAIDPVRASIQSEIRGWIREQTKDEDGLVKIRQAMRSDREVASVIYHSPHFLMNLASDVRNNMRIDAIEAHVPDAYQKLEASIALSDTAAKYPRAIAGVRRSFFNAGLAAKASQRVQI
ncbi:MAG TPA: hypothetical protein VHS33_06460 [Sphingomicrobium sp.]|jgi:hypothetical protein|nr:hypothetical protein [Sphingomicrobium sp.]